MRDRANRLLTASVCLPFIGLVYLCVCAPLSCSSYRSQPREVWISNVLAKPQEYWNAEVKIIGIVQDINVSPKGTKQGSYLLMDINKQVIRIKILSLPDVGTNVVVLGIVGQDPENATIPFIVETSRQWVWTSFIFIAIGVLFVLATTLLILFRLFQTPAPRRSSYSGVIPSPAQRQPAFSPAEPPSAGGKEHKHENKQFIQRAETTFIDQNAINAAQKKKQTLTVELEVIAGPDKGKRFHFTRSTITIGRVGRRINDVELNDITISREQARLELNRNNNGFILKNEGKTNPSLVNGNALAVTHLKTGDELLVGTTLIKFRLIE